MDIITINGLSVEYYRHNEIIAAVRNVSLILRKGETLALVGESGSGKSTLALALLGLIAPDDGRIASGEIWFREHDLLANTAAQWQALRGKDIAMVFQDPFSSLNPVLTIGEQVSEAVSAHLPELAAGEVTARVTAALAEVRFDDPVRIFNSYPHQLSGGQRQRVVIAMAIINRPQLLIADEPTTALDVTIQKEILDLLDSLKRELSLTVLLITHNLPLAVERSQRVAVMYAGEIVELNDKEALFAHPLHPYAQALIRSIPRLKDAAGGRYILPGQVPDLTRLPDGCSFAPRCERATIECRKDAPPVCWEGNGQVKCFLYRQKGGNK